jgi:hypothetical protein
VVLPGAVSGSLLSQTLPQPSSLVCVKILKEFLDAIEGFYIGLKISKRLLELPPTLAQLALSPTPSSVFKVVDFSTLDLSLNQVAEHFDLFVSHCGVVI